MIPRFEFRAFAQGFGLVAARLRRASVCLEIAERVDTYLIASEFSGRSVKIRDGQLQSKRLLEERDRLERWRPEQQRDLPLRREYLPEFVPTDAVPGQAPARAEYSVSELLTEIVQPSATLTAAAVSKRRSRFAFGGCDAEIVELLVNGAAIRSMAVEAEDPEAVLHSVRALGLIEYENLDYSSAIRRIVGLDQWPGGGPYG